jgi:hypothetical protein
MTPRARLALLAVLVGASVAGPASPAVAHRAPPASRDAALTWNAIAIDAVLQTSGYAPIYVAYTQAAAYDAFTKIDGRYRPYHDFDLPAAVDASRASADAAVAAATYTTLIREFPSQPAPFADNLKAKYDAFLATLPDRGKADGIAIGEAAATDMVAFRAGDGVGAPITFVPGAPDLGVWQFVPPPSAQSAALPWLGYMRPFLLLSPSQFRPGPPPSLGSRLYARDYEEVKQYGSASSTVRTPEQSAIAFFETANTTVEYNTMWRDVAVDRDLSAARTMRLLALGNLAFADALIACFDAKYEYVFWRPTTAIRRGDEDGNARTVGDPSWTSFLVAPNHPEYPSAHGAVTSASANALASVLRTHHIDVDVTGLNIATGQMDATQHFETVGDMLDEMANARIWAGYHFRNSMDVGERLGRQVVDWSLDHYFQRTHRRGHDDESDA